MAGQRRTLQCRPGWTAPSLFAVLGWLCVLVLVRPATAATDLAVTFDDLPTHGARVRGMSRLEIARRILGTLKEHRVPEVYGFVNGGQIRDDPAHLDVLKAWTQAGFRLGNHTFAHLDLSRVTAATYLADIQANEGLLAELSPGQTPKLFRFPYLHEGDSPDKRRAVRAWLRAHGYRIAQVTVDFFDWAWNDPYARCRAREDAAAIQELKRGFLETALQQLRWSEELGRRLFTRPIPHILLLHVGAFDALMLDELLSVYRQAGVRFVGLSVAIRDPAYAQDPDVVGDDELTFLEQLAVARHLLPPSTPPLIPLKKLEALCR